MADELRLTISLAFSKGGASVTKVKNLSLDVTGDAFTNGVQQIGTSEESISISADIGTPGYVLLCNLDSSNYVEFGSTTGVYDIKLKAGEVALYRHNSGTIYAKANTSPCNVEFIAIED